MVNLGAVQCFKPKRPFFDTIFKIDKPLFTVSTTNYLIFVFLSLVKVTGSRQLAKEISC